jgi:hypothetical protein
MRMKKLLAVVIGTTLLTCGQASAQESLKGAVMVFAKGACTRFVVSGQRYPCTAVIYSHFKNGRRVASANARRCTYVVGRT